MGLRLAAEAVEGAALALERVHDVHRRDGLSASVLSVGHGVADHVLEEDLEHAARLLVDETADALDTATASQAADGGLGDALDVVTEDLAMALGTALAEALASLAASSHGGWRVDGVEVERRMSNNRQAGRFLYAPRKADGPNKRLVRLRAVRAPVGTLTKLSIHLSCPGDSRAPLPLLLLLVGAFSGLFRCSLPLICNEIDDRNGFYDIGGELEFIGDHESEREFL